MFNDLETYGNAMDFVSAMVEVRKTYDEIKSIADDETYTEQERREAKELTKGGIYEFIGIVQTANGKGD